MSQNVSTAVMQRRVEYEEWRGIEGWPGYEVSDQGRVRSWKRPAAGRVWEPDYDSPPRILKFDIRNGYPSVVLCDRELGRKWESIHRLVLYAFVGPCPIGWHGAHGDGTTTNNRLSNLRWASPSENNADKIQHGTHQCGERIGSAKLTVAQVAEITRRRRSGERIRNVAESFGVCRNTITNITQGHSWKEVRRGAE